MSILNSEPTQKVGLIQANPTLTFIVMLILILFAVGSTGVGGYYIGQAQKTNRQLAQIGEDLSDLESKIGRLEDGVGALKANKMEVLETPDPDSQLTKINHKLDDIDRDISEIKSDIGSMIRKIGY